MHFVNLYFLSPHRQGNTAKVENYDCINPWLITQNNELMNFWTELFDDIAVKFRRPRARADAAIWYL